MTQRVNSAEQSADLFQKFTEFLAASRESSIEDPIRDLVAVRAQALRLHVHVNGVTDDRPKGPQQGR